jgi:hypothetical protein
MKARKRPIGNPVCPAMLYRIQVDVINVPVASSPKGCFSLTYRKA